MPKTFYIGVKALIINKNKVLLLKAKSKDSKYYWDLPGGRMEENETNVQTLNRELKEELPSISNIQISDLIGCYKFPKTLNDGQGLMLLIYKVNADLNEIKLSNEHLEYKWLSKEELLDIQNEAEINPEYKNIIYKSL